MYVLDTSVLVALLAREAGAGAVRQWLGQQNRQLAITHWTIAEFASAMAAKVRDGQMKPEDRLRATQELDRLALEAFHVAPLLRWHFEEAARLCSRADLILRAPDAIHVAVALELSAILVTNDKAMSTAARVLGITVETP